MKHLSLLFITIFLACESPFSTEPTDDDIFSVTHNYNGGKIYHPTPITLEWSNITIKKFKEFLVERSITIGDSTIWEERARILDSLSTAYTDSIDDDATFQYRVRIVDQDDQFILALAEPFTVPLVTTLRVPNDYKDPQKAFDSKFIDDGDTIKVYPGLYIGHFEFLNKNTIIRAITIPQITLLGAAPGRGSVVTINMGTLEGFTVIGGEALAGGGIYAEGSTIIRNCIIRNNRVVKDEKVYPSGIGGGIYLQDEVQIIRCRIVRNYSQRKGGGILTDGNNAIINCIIDNNFAGEDGAGLYQQSGQLKIRNTKFKRNSARWSGGAIIITTVAEVYNCLFEKNKSGGGGGLTIYETGNADIVNCVFYKNWTFPFRPSGAIVNFGEVAIINTIVWDNSGEKDYKFYPRYAEYTTSDEFRIASGVGNLKLNPLFVNINKGDYHLSANSPCVNAGHPDGVYSDTDGSRNDMGIYGGPYGDD